LTIGKEFLDGNNPILLWRIQVIYSSGSESSEGIFDGKLNEGPKGGRCSINPSNGTLLTLFTINCSNWSDKNGIKDYSFFGWSKDPSDRLMIARSTSSITSLRLPANIHLVASIEDTLRARTEYNLSSVIIVTDPSLISSFLQAVEGSSANDSILDALKSADVAVVGQMIMSLSQVLNVAGRSKNLP
jgi:hypothetical protein